jgi:hypothetical protein
LAEPSFLMAQEHNLVFTPHTWTDGMGVVANAHLTAGICFPMVRPNGTSTIATT